MLLVGGVVGLVFLAAIGTNLFSYPLRLPIRSTEFGVVSAVFIVFMIQSILTGQFFGSTVMFSYITGLICVSEVNRRNGHRSRSFRTYTAMY